MSSAPDPRGLRRRPNPSADGGVVGGGIPGGRGVPSPGTVPRRSATWFLPVVLLLSLVGLILYSSWSSLAPATPVRLTPVVVKPERPQEGAPRGESSPTTAEHQGDPVGRGAVAFQAPGWLEPDPHPNSVAALTAGVVDKVLVLEGDTVARGQVLVTLIDEDARLARDLAEAVLQGKRSRVSAAEATLRAAEAELDTLVGPRERVARTRAGLVRVESEQLQLDARIQAAAAEVAAIGDEFARKSRLVGTEVVSKAEVERLRLRLESTRAALAAVEAEREVLAAAEVAAKAASEAAARDLELLIAERRAVELAVASLAESQAAVVAAEAERDIRQLALERTKVRSPVSGVVLQRMVVPGDTLVAAGPTDRAAVMQLYDPERMQVRVDIPLTNAGLVVLGQHAEIVVDALPDDIFTGTVIRVVHFADIAKNTVEVKVSVDAPKPVLKPNMLARVRFLESGSALGSQGDAEPGPGGGLRLFAPADTLISVGADAAGDGSAREGVVVDGANAAVFVATRNRSGALRAVRTPVRVGARGQDPDPSGYVEILGGLRPGDQLVVQPPADLLTGDFLKLEGGTP